LAAGLYLQLLAELAACHIPHSWTKSVRSPGSGREAVASGPVFFTGQSTSKESKGGGELEPESGGDLNMTLTPD